MAKLKKHSWTGPAARALRARKVRITVAFRAMSDGKFEACVRSTGGDSRTPARSAACRSGRNPRVALSKALHRFATQVNQRSGAFKGLK